MNKLGRPVRLGLISAASPREFEQRLRRRFSLGSASADLSAQSVLREVEARCAHWTAFSVDVGDGLLDGERYQLALRWLLNAGVDAVVCTCPLRDTELRIVGANQQARRLGVPVVVADADSHIDAADWAQGVVLARADHTLADGEAVWQADPDICRVGGVATDSARAAGVVAGVAVAELADALPPAELLDALRAWTLLPPSRLAS